MQNTCKLQDLIVQIRTKNKVKFKAGADLSTQVSIANVEVIEEQSDERHLINLQIELKKEWCDQAPVKP